MRQLRYLLIPLALSANLDAAVLWVQGFTTSTVVTDYVGNSANQADGITSSGSGVNWSADGSSLIGTRSAGNSGSFTINGDNWGASVLLTEMRFQIADVTSSATTSIMLAVGSGFTTGNSHPTNAATHSDFSINLTNGSPDSFRFRDHDNGTNLGNAIDGTSSITVGTWVDIWWGVNNSGSAVSYTRPDGGTDTLADDRWALWAKVGGSWYLIGNNPVNTANNGSVLDDFKITFSDGLGVLKIDSIKISDTLTAVPEVSSASMALVGICGVLVSRRRQCG
ncbi:MAG: hypothetical protein EOP85_04040 [Verrucomicrobiaceae bacterium]|nr:MAG: hypothetical protein EOP85_04040 [Verrucomicrobiaceae bacterium]